MVDLFVKSKILIVRLGLCSEGFFFFFGGGTFLGGRRDIIRGSISEWAHVQKGHLKLKTFRYKW